MKLITGISGGAKLGPPWCEDGNIHTFRPGEEPAFLDDAPIELVVDGYEGPPNESRPVAVKLLRGRTLVYHFVVNRLSLVAKPELVTREVQ